MLYKQFIILTCFISYVYSVEEWAKIGFIKSSAGASKINAKLTQEIVAGRVGLSRTSITNIEKGRQHVSLHLFLYLASAVGAHPTELLPDKVSSGKTGMIHDHIQKKSNLEDEHLEWVTSIVTSGIGQDDDEKN